MSLERRFSCISINSKRKRGCLMFREVNKVNKVNEVNEVNKVNEVVDWHQECAKNGKTIVVNNLFLQSLFSNLHEIYKTNKNAFGGWKYGAIYKSIYDQPNIDITKANAEFYYSIV